VQVAVKTVLFWSLYEPGLNGSKVLKLPTYKEYGGAYGYGTTNAVRVGVIVMERCLAKAKDDPLIFNEHFPTLTKGRKANPFRAPKNVIMSKDVKFKSDLDELFWDPTGCERIHQTSWCHAPCFGVSYTI